MAFEAVNVLISLPAAADLSTHQYNFVKVDTSGNAALCSAAGEAVVGVLQNKPSAAGQVAQICILGITKVKVGSGTVTVGDLVATDASALAKTAVKSTVDTTSGSDSATAPLVGSAVAGRCVGTGTTGTYASVLLLPIGAVATTAA